MILALVVAQRGHRVLGMVFALFCGAPSLPARRNLASTVYHRSLRRKVSYEELLHLEALKIVRLCLEDTPYKPFRPWW